MQGEGGGAANARLENVRTDWLWKADQAQTADTLPDVNLRGMTALILVQKCNSKGKSEAVELN